MASAECLRSMHLSPYWSCLRMKTSDRTPVALVPQGMFKDDLLTEGYDIAPRMERMTNLLPHFVLAISAPFQTAGVDSKARTLNGISLQVTAFITRDLGRMLSPLTMACRQVWLAQTPLSETCRRTLRTLPVVPCQMFGPAALEALKCSRQGQAVLFTDLRPTLQPEPWQTATSI